MNVDVSERAFEDAIEAALLRRARRSPRTRSPTTICRPADIRSAAPRTTTRASASSRATLWTSSWQRSPVSGRGSPSITGRWSRSSS